MLPNFIVLIGAAFIPMILGYVWFHPNVFGGENWYNMADLSSTKRKEVSTLKLLSTLILNFFIGFGLFGLSVHQFGVFGLVGGNVELLSSGTAGAFMAEYGGDFLTFGHGVLHAILQGVIGFVIPVLGYVAIFEHKSFKYFLVYLGYWTISLVLMGGCICAWGAVPAV